MTENFTRTPKGFADSVLGKILVGLAVAAGSALISWIVSRATYVPPPLPRPAAEITPDSLLAKANQLVEFSAAGSVVPSSFGPSYRWQVGGLEPNKSPIASCNEAESLLSCRFALPGTFAVSVEVLDANGQSASAASSVTVSLPNGYLGMILRSEDRNALYAILYDIDWVELQSLVAQPIVLQHPETERPVYAVLAEAPSDVGDPPPWRGAAAGLKVAIPALPAEVGLRFETALSEIGLVPVVLPVSEVFAATERGAVDVGFMAIDSPAAVNELND